MGVLYKLQFSSGKAYIGITRTDLAQRVDGHRKSEKKAKDALWQLI